MPNNDDVQKSVPNRDDYIHVLVENSRMRLALQCIRAIAETPTDGTWRYKVAEIVDIGLRNA